MIVASDKTAEDSKRGLVEINIPTNAMRIKTAKTLIVRTNMGGKKIISLLYSFTIVKKDKAAQDSERGLVF